MKIAVISSSAPFGKGESFVINEVNAIAMTGHDVLLVPTQLRQSNPNQFELHKRVKLLAQASLSLSVLMGFIFFALQSPRKLLSLLEAVSDKQLLNLLKNYLVVPKAIWLAGQMKQQNIQHIHAHWLTTSATLAFLAHQLTGIPWSCTAHRGDIVASNLLEAKCSSACFIRFISKSGVELAKDRADICDTKIRVLHLGVELPMLGCENQAFSDESSTRLFTIICPANLIAVKGHCYLIEAISRMRQGKSVRLLLAGDGYLRDKLSRQVREFDLELQVDFKGHIPHSDLLQLYQNKQVDLVVLPSLDLGGGLHEGIPVSLMEAMSFNIPVISTETGGIPELLHDDEHAIDFGVMVTAGDSEMLALEIDRMVDSASYRGRWAELGRRRIDDLFNQQKNVGVLIKLIQNASGVKEEV